MTINKHTLIASLSISSWSGRRIDKEATAEVAVQHAAAPESGRFNKNLFPGCPYIKDIAQSVSHARNRFSELTLPWGDSGERIFPVAKLQSIVDEVSDMKYMFDTAVANFLTNYTACLSDAERQLGGLFDANDYPAQEVLRKKYNFSFHVFPMPSKEDFRVSLPDDTLNAIKQDLEETVTARLKAADEALLRRLLKVVDRVATTLPTGKTFRDSLVTDLDEICEVATGLNVTGNQHITAAVQMIRQRLSNNNADTLRSDPTARTVTAAHAADIATALKQILGGGSDQ